VLVAGTAPWVGGALVVALLGLLRTADSAALAHVRRRERRPGRAHEGLRTALALPWHATSGAVATLAHLPVPVAGGALVGGAAATGAVLSTTTARALQVGAAVLVAVVLLLSWRGRRGQAVRRASSWALQRAAGTPGSRAVVVAAAALLLVVLAALALPSGPQWWPLGPPTALRDAVRQAGELLR
jgi:hypothetical protein